jgi:hypothetical protein
MSISPARLIAPMPALCSLTATSRCFGCSPAACPPAGRRRLTARSMAVAGLVAALTLVSTSAPASAQIAPSVTVLTSGLNNPRGLTFGDDGAFYVAEGGTGGTQSTVGLCTQVVPPVGPETGGMTARISKISPDGTRTTVVDGLPSTQIKLASLTGGLPDVAGVAAVAFVHDRLEALISGAGCSHGNAGTSNGVIRVDENGSTTQVADLSAFLAANPAANPDAADFEPDGTWYGMVRVGRDLYATEPNHQELDRITGDGHVSRVVDFSKTFPGNADWRGPTALARRGRFLYVGTLTPFPVVPGAAQVFKVDPTTGQFSVFADGLTTVLGLAFDQKGALYVLETSVAPGLPALGLGQIVKISGHQRTTIATGLNVPTGMTFGPDGNLYVSVKGFGYPPGAGQVLKIASNTEDQDN